MIEIHGGLHQHGFVRGVRLPAHRRHRAHHQSLGEEHIHPGSDDRIARHHGADIGQVIHLAFVGLGDVHLAGEHAIVPRALDRQATELVEWMMERTLA